MEKTEQIRLFLDVANQEGFPDGFKLYVVENLINDMIKIDDNGCILPTKKSEMCSFLHSCYER